MLEHVEHIECLARRMGDGDVCENQTELSVLLDSPLTEEVVVEEVDAFVKSIRGCLGDDFQVSGKALEFEDFFLVVVNGCRLPSIIKVKLVIFKLPNFSVF